MIYDFDTVVPREGTDSISLELMRQQTGRNDLIPLWVADMAFPTPPFVLRAIEHKLQQKILGYTLAPRAYYECIDAWERRRYGLAVAAETVHFVPGIVPGIFYAVNCFTEKGDGVMILTPVYHPFGNVTRGSGRRVVEAPMKIVHGRFAIDFEAVEQKLPQCKMLVLCNPHNPGGTSWTADEVARVVRLCKRHGVIVVSDEIHADMTFAPAKHVPTLMACPEARDVTITFLSPTKAFNLPGVVASHVVVADEALRRRFFTYLDVNDVGLGNVFAYDCVRACYSAEGEEWLAQMLAYVRENINYVAAFLAEHCPKIVPMIPEASYLVFLDNRTLGFATQQELVDFYTNDAGLYLNDGSIFGAPGAGFMRLNAGQPRSILTTAMHRLAAAYKQRGM